jgi:hypothetical protein
MKRGEMRDARQSLEIEFLIEVAVDVLDHRVHAFLVFGLAAAGSGHFDGGYRPR